MSIDLSQQPGPRKRHLRKYHNPLSMDVYGINAIRSNLNKPDEEEPARRVPPHKSLSTEANHEVFRLSQ